MAQLEVIYLDAGQGDCTLILFPDGKTNWLIDCGSIKNGHEVIGGIGEVLTRVLASRGGRIHHLILTHPDQDHYNLLKYIANQWPIDKCTYGGDIKDYQNKLDNNYVYNWLVGLGNKAVSPPAIACNWNSSNVGGATVIFLAANLISNDTNDQSIVTLIEYGDAKFLFMGDAGFKTEKFILDNCPKAYPSSKSNIWTILKLGHHGSDVTSSSQAWISAVKPHMVMVSSDTRSWGKWDRSMPSQSLTTNIQSWTQLASLNNQLAHNYIVWCDDPKDTTFLYKPKMMPQGAQTVAALCTTLYQLQYNNNYSEFVATGGAWYVSAVDDGSIVVQNSWATALVQLKSPRAGVGPSLLRWLRSFFRKRTPSQIAAAPPATLPPPKHLVPMPVSTLKSLLAAVSPDKPFVLSSGTLGIDAVQDLFQSYLPNQTLTVISPSANVTDLIVAGTLSFSPYGSLPVEVIFTSDTTNVTGLSIRLALPGWDINTTFLKISVDYLEPLGFSKLYLLLTTATNATGALSARYGFSADLVFQVGSTLKLDALLSTNLQDSYIMEGSFQNVTFANISALAAFAPGGDFNIFPPDLVPFSSQLELQHVLFAIDPVQKRPLMISIDVQIGSEWVLVPGIFEFKKVVVSFSVILSKPVSISAGIYTTFQLGPDISIDASLGMSGVAPSVYMEASISEPVPMSTLLGYLGMSKDLLTDWQITYLQFYLDLKNQGFSVTKHYGVKCATSEPWEIIPLISVTSLFFSFDAQDGMTPIGTIGATLSIGSVDLILSAAYVSPTTGWRFQGGTVGDSAIPIGDLINYVAQKFNVTNLPPWLAQITLKHLNVTFETISKNFTFSVEGIIPIAETSLTIQIDIQLTAQKNDSYDKFLQGSIIIDGSIFSLSFDKTSSQETLSAAWSTTDPDKELNIADIVRDLGFSQFPDLPVDLQLKSIALAYDFTSKAFALITDSATLGKASFGSLASQYFFALNVDATINLSDLPLIGKELSGDLTVAFDHIQVIASSNFDAKSIPIVNTLIGTLSQADPGYPMLGPTTGISSGVGLSMNLDAGGQITPFSLSTQKKPPTALTVLTDTDAGDVKWFDVQKTFGPVSFQKIGIRYQNQKLGILMNASFSTGGLTISLVGLGIESPLTDFHVDMTLSGLGITYAEGGVDISGSLTGSIQPLSFTGELLIATPELSISALGAYAEIDGTPSLFIYAVLDYPLGGPAFCFVTGLSAGFGFNRSLLIPDINGVNTFPLIEWAMDKGNPPGMNPSGDIGTQVAAVLATLSSSGVVAPSIGEDWLAIGLRFTSFELIDSFALLTFIFGTQFEIDLLGLSCMSLPTKSFPIAYAELAIKASFRPSDGYIGIVGQLTPKSYVFTSDCHLTGGFAYCCWFKGSQAGNIVVTLGGYSHRFTPPQFYPIVPRLGLSWQIDSNISVQGGLYYALTSCAVMAGGSLSAVWSCGGISAWFDFEADFLIVFVPFHYYMEVGVDLGASFSIDLLFTTITMTIHLGVDLAIWGPDFSGTARVDLYIISFSIDFGAGSKDTRTTIEWSDFYKQLLPHAQAAPTKQLLAATAPSLKNDPPPALIQIQVTNGLNKQLSNAPDDLNCIVNGEEAEFVVSFSIPLKEGNLTGNTVPPGPSSPVPYTAFGVGPTGTSEGSFASTCVINLTPEEEQTSTLAAAYVLQHVPTSLWKRKEFDGNGVPLGLDPLNDTTIKDVLVGYTLVPLTHQPDHSKQLYLKDLLYETDEQNIQLYTWSDQFYPATDAFKNETVATTIMATLAQNNRTALIKAIVQALLPTPASVDVQDLASDQTTYLLAPPILSLLGENKGASV